MQTITDLSASVLAEMIQAGELSALEVTEAHIRRIEAVNERINAVVIPLFDKARAQAREADERRARGEPLGPLHGVPVTIKEQYRVAGTQTTLGATNQIGNVYHDEGPLVTKLRQAGAIILGKTNIIQTLAGPESDNRVYGRSNNPWNLERTPGGSSGGEAAIIAARGSALGLAGDFGGSTRIPAHFCGLHGLKPTSGRLTNDDFATGLLGYGQEVFIPQPGPIARTVADLQLAMAVLAETSLHTTYDLVPPVPWPDPNEVRVEGMRIGFYTDNGYFPAAPALRRAVEEAAEALQDRGASVAPFTPPDAAEAVRIFLGAVTSGGGDDYQRLLGDEKPIPQVAGMLRGLHTPPFVMSIIQKVMAAQGQRYLAHMMQCMGPRSTEKYWKLVEARTDYRARFIQALDTGNFDAVICPPFALPALTHGSSEHLFPALTYALTYNILGAPAGVVAATRVRPGEESDREVSKDLADITAQQVEKGSAGLPVGVQVVARHWREDIVLAVMAALEAHFRPTADYPEYPPI
ncbi:MAG TPA: amidase [Thermoflexia bacterium]|jgi:fatty acid amide hydrolase|nr:amidase [Thermoflexia bacterium]